MLLQAACTLLTATVCGAHIGNRGVHNFESKPTRLRQSCMGLPKPRILDEQNAKDVLSECMQELGTMFGTNAESRNVGITGLVSFVDLEGPVLVISLHGRFWHQRTAVVERVSKYVMDRIPECVGVDVVDQAQLDDTDPTDLDAKCVICEHVPAHLCCTHIN